MKIVSARAKNLNEKDLQQMVKNPTFMRNKWRARLRVSADALAKERDPEKIKKYKIMYSKQKLQLKEWDDKVKKKKLIIKPK